jgi:class 3 adenylate cyclase
MMSGHHLKKDKYMPEERKLVTILFADVTDSTALGDTLDPEDIRALMSRYYTHARQIIPSYGGTLEKFIGDAVMAIFGLPQAHSDDAERALAAALALRAAIVDDPVLGASFSLRMGVNTGEVITANNHADGDFLITGDAVNVAARLQQSAIPGEILVGERTMKAAQMAFLFDMARQIEVRGKRQPLRAFTLKIARPTRQVERPPFIGRRQDLLQLSLLQARTLEEKRPQLISLVAPSGTGKTRLLEEFLHRLDPADGFQVATIRCLPYGQTLTYWPLRGLLTKFLGEEISKQGVMDIFLQGGYEQEEAREQAEYILATLGIEKEGKEGTIARGCIFSAWRLLVEILAQQAPRVIIFEDLHWASDSLLDLIEYMINLHIQAPLLLITLSRPEFLDRRPQWGGGRSNFTALTLQPLTAAQTRDLIRRSHPELPEHLGEQIVTRSGGNPFFALELIQGVCERCLAEGGDAFDSLPDTIHAAVLARLDLLTPKEREVLQVASVTPRTFHLTMLEAVLEHCGASEIDDALEGLQARDLIVASEKGRFFFRHVLIRDVAYGTLARADRIRLNGKIAAWMETVAEHHLDEFTELIAYHHLEAVRLARQSAVPLDFQIDPTQAIRFLRRAGIQAARAGAFTEAQRHIQNAIEIAPESELLSLYEELADCGGWSESAVHAYKHAIDLWRDTPTQDPLIGARLQRKLLVCYARGAGGVGLKPDEECRLYETLQKEAQHCAEAAGDEDELWRLRIASLFTHSYIACDSLEEPAQKAEIIQKREVGLQAEAYFREKGDWAAVSEALDGYASLSQIIGAYEDVLTASQRRLTAPDLPALEHGDALQMIAKAYHHLGDYDACIATIQKTLAHLRRGHSLVYLGSGISHAVDAAYISGRWSDVLMLRPRVEELWEQIQPDASMRFCVGTGYMTLLEMALAQEDNAAIDAAASVLMRLFPDASDPKHTFVSMMLADDPMRINDLVLDLIAEKKHSRLLCLRFCNERDAALSQTQLNALREKMWYANDQKRYLAIAQAIATDDDEQLAREIDAAEAQHMVVHAARMRIVLAQHTNDRSQLERARPILERLNDRYFLCRLEEVMEALTMHAA